MKLQIQRDHFSNGLGQVLNVVGSRSTSPILSNVLLESSGGDRVSLTTTNLDVAIRCSIKAAVSEPGSVTLPVRRLASIVRELPDNSVSVESTPGHQCKLVSGRSNFRIMGMSADEFPPFADFSEDRSVTLDQAQVSDMIRSVSYAQSQDETRYILNGVYFRFEEGRLSLVATDGRRLAVVTRDLGEAVTGSGSFILPAKTVTELTRLLDKGQRLRIAFNDRRAAFEIDSDNDAQGFVDRLQLVSRVVEGNYPNYLQVVPKEVHHRVKLERELFSECVHRAALVCSDKANSVRLKLTENVMEISASSPDFGEANESLAIEYSGPEVQIAFNPSFLLDPLKALVKDEIYFDFKDEMSPGVLKTNDQFLCVVMPVRLS